MHDETNPGGRERMGSGPGTARTPTVAEMRAYGEALRHMHALLRQQDRRSERKSSSTRPTRIDGFHEAFAGLYEPVHRAIDQLKSGYPEGIEPAVRFLEADVYCFGSGHAKQEAIHFLTQNDLPLAVVERLRRVVLNFVDSYDRREQRSYFRLARRVDSDELRAEVRTRTSSDDRRVRRRARWVLNELERPN